MSTNTPRKHLRWLANRLQAYAQNCEQKAAAGQLRNPENLYRELFSWESNGWAANNLVIEALKGIGLEGARKGKNGNLVVYQKGGPTPENVPNQEPLMRALLAAGVPRRDAFQAWDLPTEECLKVLDTLINQHVKPPDADTGRTIFDCLIEALRAITPAPPTPSTADNKRFTAFEGRISRADIARKEKITERAVDKSLAKVRAWREYVGINQPNQGNGKRRRTSAVDPKIQAETVAAPNVPDLNAPDVDPTDSHMYIP